jgi:hypothetical protein
MEFPEVKPKNTTPRTSRKKDEERSPKITTKSGKTIRISSPSTQYAMMAKGIWDPRPTRFTTHPSPDAMRPIAQKL